MFVVCIMSVIGITLVFFNVHICWPPRGGEEAVGGEKKGDVPRTITDTAITMVFT